MRLENEDQLLDQDIRAKIIEEILSDENVRRKRECYRRYECYKDQTKKYVVEQIKKQFDNTTVEEMSWSVSNINLTRKIIDKLARVYSNGVARTVEKSEEDTKHIEAITKAISVDTSMKKLNRFLKLQKNMALYVKPYKCFEAGAEKWGVKLEVLSPYLYDILEDPNDQEKPLCFVLSDYLADTRDYVASTSEQNVSQAGRAAAIQVRNQAGEKKSADDAGLSDKDRMEFVFWSQKFHFTCNVKGEIIAAKSPNGNLNPIQTMSLVEFAIDPDGKVYAIGGDDLVDGAILVNSMITFTNHIGVTQGYGQFWMKGKNLPKFVKTGPNKAILLESETKEDPESDIGFANANPKMAELMQLIEMYVALLLTSNNLTTKGVSLRLEGGASFPSGIALIIDKAESIEDVQDQQQIFHDKEPRIFELITRWLTLYGTKGLLKKDLAELKVPKSTQIRLKFNEATPIMSEKEKLDNLKLRQELGINTQIEILMKDDPALTKEEAEKKLLEILEERVNLAAKAVELGLTDEENPDDDEGEGSNSDGDKNGGKDRAGSKRAPKPGPGNSKE